jgi:segregation and condensation protein A
MQRLIEDQKRRVPRQVEPNPLSVLERMSEMVELLRSTWSLLFSSVAGPERIRAEWVVTLLALLELVRLGEARARQAELFGEIVIERNAVSVREPARAIEEPPDLDEPAEARPEDEPRPESGESLNA